MALPFTIHLNPPYIVVSIARSLNGFIADGNISFGIIEQINYDTLGFLEGGAIMFYLQDASKFGNNPSGFLEYFVLDSRKIIFTEEPPLALP